MARQIPEMSLEERLEGADCRAVAAALPKGSSLVELIRFSPCDFRDGPGARGWAVPDASPHHVNGNRNDVQATRHPVVPLGPLALVRRILPGRSKSRLGSWRKVNPTEDASRSHPPRYLAFILAAEEPDQVQMVDLGEARIIDSLIADFRESIGRGFRSWGYRDVVKMQSAPEVSHDTELGRALRAAVFDPLVISLGGPNSS